MEKIETLKDFRKTDIKECVCILVENRTQLESALRWCSTAHKIDDIKQIEVDTIVNPPLYLTDYKMKVCIINFFSHDYNEFPIFIRMYLWSKLRSFILDLKQNAKRIILIDMNQRELMHDTDDLYTRNFAEKKITFPSVDSFPPEIVCEHEISKEKKLYLKKLFNGSKVLRVSNLDNLGKVYILKIADIETAHSSSFYIVKFDSPNKIIREKAVLDHLSKIFLRSEDKEKEYGEKIYRIGKPPKYIHGDIFGSICSTFIHSNISSNDIEISPTLLIQWKRLNQSNVLQLLADVFKTLNVLYESYDYKIEEGSLSIFYNNFYKRRIVPADYEIDLIEINKINVASKVINEDKEHQTIEFIGKLDEITDKTEYLKLQFMIENGAEHIKINSLWKKSNYWQLDFLRKKITEGELFKIKGNIRKNHKKHFIEKINEINRNLELTIDLNTKEISLFDKIIIPNPLYYYFQLYEHREIKKKNFRQIRTFIHGDFHLGNVIVDKNEHSEIIGKLIDFAFAGEGYLEFDFAEFETDIKSKIFIKDIKEYCDNNVSEFINIVLMFENSLYDENAHLPSFLKEQSLNLRQIREFYYNISKNFIKRRQENIIKDLSVAIFFYSIGAIKFNYDESPWVQLWLIISAAKAFEKLNIKL